MTLRRPKTGLSRKVVAYYLCFCLGAVCWVAAALLFTTHALLCNRAANGCIARLGKASAAIEMYWLRSGADSLDEIVGELQHECRAAYWAVVGLDGKFLTHTNVALKGATA